MGHNILQWNCRGLKPNYNEIILLLTKYTPSVVCLQETFLKDTDDISFKGHTLYNYINTDTNRACGGSSIVVNNRTPHRNIVLNTNLQAVAVNVTLHRPITICSIYIPPTSILNPDDLTDLVNQLPEPYLLLGDFNGHNEFWGCNYTNPKGMAIEKFIDDNQLCLLNDKSKTYLHPATGHFSALDLSICHPNSYLDYEWKVLDDLCGSDHFPIVLTNNSPILDPLSRYKFNKADWDQFQTLCSQSLVIEEFEKFRDTIERFSLTLLDIADQSIPKTKPSNKKHDKPWYNDSCKTSVRKRRAALRKFEISPTHENLENLKIIRAKARRSIKDAKRKSWQSYVSKLNSRSSTKKVWDMIRKINGKNKSSNVCHLKRPDNTIASSTKDIADTLAEGFAKNSSSENYSSTFQHVKEKAERTPLMFKSNNEKEYNRPFSLNELLDSLNKAHDTAVGPDEVHYQLLKHLPRESLKLLLAIYNDIWVSGNVPDSWKEATVIPIPKPGKDHTDPKHYRPISLTSCVCKTLERMINSRLVWYLESQHIITEFQSGFRKQRSTNDHLVRLENYIREAFINKQHLVSVFFDLEKAYDTTWKYGILKDLKGIGLNGRLPTFVSGFLSDRNFNVRVGSTLSDMHLQEQGVPQGSILSVTLFSIKLNNIVKCLSPGVESSLYVDDFLICYCSKSMRTIERQLQQCLDRVHVWATENGFKFSKSKTQCVHFCNSRKLHDDPHLTLNNTPIPVVKEAKFLGVIFDSKLSFIPHIKYLKAKCLKALNILKYLSNTNWGGDKQVLLRLYRSLIRSKLDYGSIVYGSARKSYLQMLDTVHHQGLRLALGAFRTSPVQSLYVEANEPPLRVRREKLSLQYAAKLAANQENPAHATFFTHDDISNRLFENKPNAIKPIRMSLKESLEQTSISPNKIKESGVIELPPWTIESPAVLYDLTHYKKSDTNSISFKSHFNELKSKYADHFAIYTDGSKDGQKVGCASISKLHRSKLRLPDGASIFSAEIKAIQLALNFITTRTENKFIIFTDSLSVLQALTNRKWDHPLIQEVLLKHHTLCKEKSLVFCWVPSHVGIRGNEEADRAAKASLELHQSSIKLPYTDFKPNINVYIKDTWQSSWNEAIFNKLHAIMPTLGEWHSGNRTVRREEVVLARCRIGHTRLTHSYLLKREDQPECIPCQEPFTVEHFLIRCTDLQLIRNKYFNVSSLNQLFNTVPMEHILSFLKETGLYKKI